MQEFNLLATLELLKTLEQIKDGKLRSPELKDDYNVELYRKGKRLYFNIPSNEFFYLHDEFNFSNLKLSTSDISVHIPYLVINNKGTEGAKGYIYEFEYKKVERDSLKHFRLFLPISSNMNFAFSIENLNIRINGFLTYLTSNALKASFDDKVFHMFVVSNSSSINSEEKYLVIDCDVPLLFEDFTEYCFSILLCFGYVSGDFVNDRGFYVQYDTSTYSDIIGIVHREMRGTIDYSYVPTYSNPHGYIHDSTKAQPFIGKIRTLRFDEFSRLCKLCIDKDYIKTSLLLLMEADKLTLVSRPGILSIVLETLTNLLYEENKEDLVPIKDRSTAKKLRQELIETVNNFTGEVSAESKSLIVNKLSHINQVTNRSKLLLPFTILKIPIEQSDIEAIEKRNSFLHGKIPIIAFRKDNSLNEEDKVRFYLSLKQYVLIAAIIMKYIGFDSLIVNYPKIYENSTGVPLDELLYRQI
jgi:hypothetical protein